jgi:C1A family cysteine protease
LIVATEWSSYTGGVFSSSDCSSSAFKLDHAIQLVGYNAEASTPYWIVRNSWDTTWGEDGYIYLEMGVNACGIADKAAIVQL